VFPHQSLKCRGSSRIALPVQNVCAAFRDCAESIVKRHRARGDAVSGLAGNIGAQMHKAAKGSVGEGREIPGYIRVKTDTVVVLGSGETVIEVTADVLGAYVASPA
jgi:hypothetical protein